MAEGIYNLCLVPARLDAHSCFPPYNKIKQLRDISSLLADEIPASASLLHPAQGCSLFLPLKTWRVAAAAFFCPQMGDLLFFPAPPLHFQSLWVRGAGGLGLWHLLHLSFIPSPASEGPQRGPTPRLMAPVQGVPTDVTAAGGEKAAIRRLLARGRCPAGVYFSVPHLHPLPWCLALETSRDEGRVRSQE